MEIKYQVVLVDKRTREEYVLSTKLSEERAEKLVHVLRVAADPNHLQIYETRPYIQ